VKRGQGAPRRAVCVVMAQAGFSLIELMIAMTMGLFIVIALAAVLVNVNRNNTELSRTNSVVENARFALQVLETDLSHLGFWGGYIPEFDDLSRTAVPTASSVPTTLPDPCLSYSTTNWDTAYQYQMVAFPIQVYEVSSAGVAPTIGTCVTTSGVSGNLLPNPQANTHVLVVRHAAPCMASSSATDEDCNLDYKTSPTAQGAVYFQTYRCASTSTPTSGFNLTAATDADLSNFTLMNRGCISGTPPTKAWGYASTDLAPVYKFVSHIYYIRNYSVTAGDGIPTLMRLTFRTVNSSGTNVLKYDSADALVEGVEAFRVELGIDDKMQDGTQLLISHFQAAVGWASASNQLTTNNRGDGKPDTFKQCPSATSLPSPVAACSAFDLMNVVALKLYVLVRANTTTPGYTDGKTYTLGDTTAGGITLTPGGHYKRHLYTQAIRLTNVSMRRELP
jgi:type IV pilus assembly protein PilW